MLGQIQSPADVGSGLAPSSCCTLSSGSSSHLFSRFSPQTNSYNLDASRLLYLACLRKNPLNSLPQACFSPAPSLIQPPPSSISQHSLTSSVSSLHPLLAIHLDTSVSHRSASFCLGLLPGSSNWMPFLVHPPTSHPGDASTQTPSSPGLKPFHDPFCSQ